MKSLYLIVALTQTALLTAQQFRLSTDRNALRPSDRIVKQQVEYKDPGSSGRKLTWDFSMLSSVNEEYNLNYFIPDSTQMDTLCGMEHHTRYYYSQKHDSVWATGFENATTWMEYNKPELRMKFPFSYGDTLFSFFEGTGEYSRRLKLKVKGFTRVEADAEGELQLPGFETLRSTLRVRTTRYYTETGKDSTEMLLDSYAWYAEGIRYPVFESVKTDIIRRRKTKKSGENIRDTTIFKTSFFYPPHLQTTQVQTDDLPTETNMLTGADGVFTEASYLPNPVESILTISYKLVRPATIRFSVHNNIGIPACTTNQFNLPEGYNETQINMSHLITGTYTLYVYVDEMVMKQVVVKK